MAKKISKREAAEREWTALLDRVEAVLKTFRSDKPLYDGGIGVHGYLWVNGRIASIENCIKLQGLESEIAKIPGVRFCHFNID